MNAGVKAPCSATPEESSPEVLTFEQFAVRHGAGRGQIGEAALHMSAASKSVRTHQRQVLAQARKDHEVIVQRAQLQVEYDHLVAAGRIRPPTAKEEVIWRANGHPDNDSTQAARRIAQRRGWNWQAPG